jgi:glutamate 5-kinase
MLTRCRRIVVKVGTNTICDDAGRLDHKAVSSLARQIAELMRSGLSRSPGRDKLRPGGHSVTLVASGAIGSGIGELDLPARPRKMPQLQAVAAVGQGQLMRAFHDAFARHGVKVAQVLLTREDFEHRSRYLNIRNTLAALEGFAAMPIINENDTVAVDEIRFGDNDILAALVTTMLGADLLVFLTNVDGLMKGGQVLDYVERVDQETMALVRGDRSSLGSGGMASKLAAVALVTRAGQFAAVANARAPGVIARLLAGERIGTVFAPSRRRMSSRARWIGQVARPAGRILIDEGAARALSAGGKSLLPSGVVAVAGQFERGATVSIIDPAGKELARGLTNYSSRQIDKIKGLKTSAIAKVLGEKPCDEVVHRNNMTLE